MQRSSCCAIFQSDWQKSNASPAKTAAFKAQHFIYETNYLY